MKCMLVRRTLLRKSQPHSAARDGCLAAFLIAATLLDAVTV